MKIVKENIKEAIKKASSITVILNGVEIKAEKNPFFDTFSTGLNELDADDILSLADIADRLVIE